MVRTLVVFSLGLFLSGCVAQPEAPEAVAAAPSDGPAQQPRIVCRKEKPTGSNRPVNVCREVSSAVDREYTRKDMDMLQRQTEATDHK